ncbi:acyltransferase family protein [Sorangium cellulosum]|nr:acyltransferase family protein [Sorangium cellulosum]
MQAAGEPPAIEPSARAAKPRVEWVDYAKGICIFFVVMLHANGITQERMREIGWLEEVVEFARPFRMPDFFLIAGLFLASALRRPWRRYLDTKVVHFFYFYLLWMTLRFLVVDLDNLVRADGATAHGVVLVYLRRWIDPIGTLWFIHMLPIFFVVTRLLRSVPPWGMWLGAAALHSAQIATEWTVIDNFASRYVFFYSGYVLAPHIFRIAAWAHARAGAALGYLLGWGVLNGLLVAAGWALLPGVSLALGYAGALAVIFVAVMLSKLSWTGPLRYLGENSLVVYLGDFWVSRIANRALALAIGDVGSLALATTVASAIGTVLLWRVVMRTPGRFMYVRPRWLRLDDGPPPREQDGRRPLLAA